jgi:L-alanine-DL-glutamate epimerase-like enolase superfamily enzyme
VEGIAAFAISAIDMALWHLKGKLLGQPVARLLGGQVRTEIPAMGSIIFDMDDLDWTLNEFAFMRDEGYGIVKAAGDDARVGLRLGPRPRLALGRAAAVPSRPRRAPARARGRGHADRDGRGRVESRDLRARHRAGGVDVVQLDPGRCLGLTGCREVIRRVEEAGIGYSAHSWSSALNTAASLHFLAISPNADTLDLESRTSRRSSTSLSTTRGYRPTVCSRCAMRRASA